MFCTNCGHRLDEQAKFCSQCGSQGGVSAEAFSEINITRTEFNVPQTNGQAAQQYPSFVQPTSALDPTNPGIQNYQFQQGSNIGYRQAPTPSGTAVAAIIVVFFFSLLGLILGYVAQNEIKKSNGLKTGSGMATTAIVLGWIFTILGFFWFIGAMSG